MRNKIVALLLTTIVSAEFIGGCGKTEEEKLADYYQSQGMSKEEAQATAQVATAFGATAEEEKAADAEREQAEVAKQEQVDSFQLVAPRAEILNSGFEEPFIQIQDELFYIDGSMTVKDVIEKLNNVYDFEITAKSGKDEITQDSLANINAHAINGVAFYDDNDTLIMSIDYDNSSDQAISIYDCQVYNIKPETDKVYALNMFEPGNLCYGIFTDKEEILSSPAYAERSKDYPTKYQDWIAKFDEIGVKYTAGSDYISFETIVNMEPQDPHNWGAASINDDPEYRVKQIQLVFNQNTALCTELKIFDESMSIEDKEEKDRIAAIPAAEGRNSHGYYYDPTVLPEEIYNYWVSFCNEDLKDMSFTNSSDLELLGYLIPIETEGDLREYIDYSKNKEIGRVEIRFVYKASSEDYVSYRTVSEVYHGQDEVNDWDWDWFVSEDGTIAYTKPEYHFTSHSGSLEKLIDEYSDEYTFVPLEQ